MKETFAHKKVLVTGHTGFKGSWMTTLLTHLGAEVVGYALSPATSPDLHSIIGEKQCAKSVIGDVRDIEKLRATILDFQPDFIFHLAAQPIVRTSYAIPIDTFDINVMGTANVLEAMRSLEKRCIAVMITTDKVYQNNETGQAYKETDPFGGYDPYSASKAAAEIVIDSYRNSFFNVANYSQHLKSVASARAGNVIGGGDWAADRLVPDIVRALVAGSDVSIRNPKAVRPWQHVLEPLTGYLLLAKKMSENPLDYNEGYNFGPYPADVATVGEMAEMALDIWGTGKLVFPEQVNQPHEAGLLRLDIEKAEKCLHWTPRWKARKALEMTLKWYRAYYAGDDMLAFTLQQIEEYLS